MFLGQIDSFLGIGVRPCIGGTAGEIKFPTGFFPAIKAGFLEEFHPFSKRDISELSTDQADLMIGGFAKAVAVEQIEPRVVALTLTQGIKRQIRLMFEAIGYRVQRLQRVRIGAFTAPELRSGRWRILSAAETAQLLARHTVIKARPAQARAGGR